MSGEKSIIPGTRICCNYYDREAGQRPLDQDARLILCPLWKNPEECILGNPQDLPFTPG